MEDNLPPGCTEADINRHFGGECEHVFGHYILGTRKARCEKCGYIEEDESDGE